VALAPEYCETSLERAAALYLTRHQNGRAGVRQSRSLSKIAERSARMPAVGAFDRRGRWRAFAAVDADRYAVAVGAHSSERPRPAHLAHR
jgi:hypothetical protein